MTLASPTMVLAASSARRVLSCNIPFVVVGASSALVLVTKTYLGYGSSKQSLQIGETDSFAKNWSGALVGKGRGYAGSMMATGIASRDVLYGGSVVFMTVSKKLRGRANPCCEEEEMDMIADSVDGVLLGWEGKEEEERERSQRVRPKSDSRTNEPIKQGLDQDLFKKKKERKRNRQLGPRNPPVPV